MNEQEVIIQMDDKLHPVGTLMYEDCKEPDFSSNWKPHRNVWRVTAHKECQEHPFAPVRLACAIEIVYQEELVNE